jgi:hypothetical protein
MRKLLWLEVIGGSFLALAFGTAASAAEVFRWTAADGSVAFTDDVKRIPAQYREQAVRTPAGDLSGYGRYTPARAVPTRSEIALAERLERLREINAADGAAAAQRTPFESTQTILRLNQRSSIAIPNDRLAGDEPIVVEQRRVRDRNNISTTHVTVVRQGDRILSVVRPESAHDRADWADESELVGELD